MNITNTTHNATWRRLAKNKRAKWSANAVAAKELKRIENAQEDAPASCNQPPVPRVQFATVSIAIGSERTTFRVMRFDERRLVMGGKVQAAATIGRRVALALDNLL